MVTSYKLGPFLGRVILPNLVAYVKQYRHTFPKFGTLGAPLLAIGRKNRFGASHKNFTFHDASIFVLKPATQIPGS